MMHHCFLIPEIVQLIYDELELEIGESPGYNRQTRRAFAGLARTCRLFHEPALDRLWCYLSSLGPLVKCMPSDLWKVQRGVAT
jgi:hypothetical protein